MKTGFLKILAVATMIMSLFFPMFVAAVSNDCDPTNVPQFSILPSTKNKYDACKRLMNAVESEGVKIQDCRNDVLACAVQTGRVGFYMVPYFISYITNFVLGLSGLICVLFIVIGGYRYVIGGLTEDKEKGKNTIRDALIGMGVSLIAWTVVNVIINAVTG